MTTFLAAVFGIVTALCGIKLFLASKALITMSKWWTRKEG